MNPAAIREVLALVVQGNPLESVSFGATVTIICGNEVSAARWRSRTPEGVLPVSRVPVQVVCVDMRAPAVSARCAPDCDERTGCVVVGRVGHWQCGWCDVHDKPRHHCGCLVLEPAS